MNKLVVNLSANTKRFDKSMKRSQSMVKRLATGLAAIATARIGAAGVREVIQLARVQAQAEKKLASVIKATGGAAGFTAKQLFGYASELQKVTNFGDEATISAMGVLAQFKNIRGDLFKKVVESAMDVSTVFEKDLQTSIEAIGKAMDDPLHKASRLATIGIVLSEQEMNRIKQLQTQGDLLGAQNVIMDALQARSGGAARDAFDPLERLAGVWSDFKESIGTALITVITPFISTLVSGLERGTRGFQKLTLAARGFTGVIANQLKILKQFARLLSVVSNWWILFPLKSIDSPLESMLGSLEKGDKAAGDAAGGAGPDAGETSTGKKFAAALGRGTQQAYSAIMNATGNKQNQKLDAVVANGREANALLRQIADQTREGSATVVPALGIA
jgi:hypothetical protein